MASAKITLISLGFLLILALTLAAPADKPSPVSEERLKQREAKEDLQAGTDDLEEEKEDLKTAASYYGGWGGWGHGGWGHYGWPYYGGYYGGYGGYGLGHWGGYGYGWPYWGGYGYWW